MYIKSHVFLRILIYVLYFIYLFIFKLHFNLLSGKFSDFLRIGCTINSVGGFTRTTQSFSYCGTLRFLFSKHFLLFTYLKNWTAAYIKVELDKVYDEVVFVLKSIYFCIYVFRHVRRSFIWNEYERNMWQNPRYSHEYSSSDKERNC